MQNNIVASEDMTIQLDNNDSGEDFVLTGRTAWITIDGYSLHINNHDLALFLIALLRRTYPPFGPGTEPLTITKLFSASTSTTCSD